ncbi:MAG: 2-C-methyl-D-erythritol 4-phosphate cytidylyltransferase [Cytophagales bacterium]|nr:2-C-methyl-D-erythritol 4-phosphate cytidylyltransferase [Cytophagales bacterium]
MNRYAIIVAGGSGSRMKSSISKQFLVLGTKPILMHTIEAFHRCNNINIILVLPVNDQKLWEELCDKHSFEIPVHIATGGKTRFHSVLNGLNSIDTTKGLVAIHDGVRPFISKEIIEKSFESAQQNLSGVVAVPLKDSIRRDVEGTNKALNRVDYKLIQTPQTFSLEEIKQAFETEYQSFFTDDASVFEHAGNVIHLVEGDYKNIKLTTPEDLIIGEAFLKSMS